MIIEENDNLIFINRLCDWLEEKGMSSDYFFEMLEEIGFVLPVRISDFVDENKSFSFLCSSANYENDNVAYRLTMYLSEPEPKVRSIAFAGIHGFWEQMVSI